LEVQDVNLVTAERGHLYEFFDGKSNETRYAIVVSCDARKCDRFISILMLGTYSTGRDTLRIKHPALPEPLYAHCGMVSYSKRAYLMEDIGIIPADTMATIDKLIGKELGIYENIRAELAFYKMQYDNVIDRLVKSGKERLPNVNEELGDKV